VNTFVPLIVRLPAAIAPPPQRVDALVSLADVLPTVLARFELPGSELLLGQFEGEDVLAGDFARDHALVERSADEVRNTKTGRELALVTRRWKLLRRADGADELHDLAGAGESVDVLARQPEVAADLRARMDAILARRPALLELERPGPENAELLEGLEDLGYVGEDE
jgi:arylsulfatase A-like enzyme